MTPRAAFFLRRFVLTLIMAGALSPLAVPGPAHAESLTITLDDCRHITRHVPAADVEYRPGVDVHGKAVAPADLEGGARLDLPDMIDIDLLIPLRSLLADPPPMTDEAEVAVGRLTLDSVTGKLFFNGLLVSDPAQHAIIEECAKRLREKR